MHYLELGGAEAALIGLLQTLDSSRVDVDLFLYDRRGELVEYIPDWVNVLPQIPAYQMLERPIKEVLRKGYILLAIRRLLGKRKATKVFKKSCSDLENYSTFFYAINETIKILPKINPIIEYDLAISFLTPHHIVLDKVKAKKKLGWIHTDYTKVWIDRTEEEKMWNRLDNIISISTDVTTSFTKVFPSLRDKIIEIENIISPDFIRKRAEEKSADEIKRELKTNISEISFLTIGRFCYPKKMEEIPYICKKLRERGIQVKWFIIGFGNELPIRESIKRTGMQENVIILGKRSNPYPYIKACDVYIQPSRYEGKSIVVREAQILGKPVIITDYPTAASQIQHGVDGFIVPMQIHECANEIYKLLKDHSSLEKIASYNRVNDFGNESEVEKVYSLIE